MREPVSFFFQYRFPSDSHNIDTSDRSFKMRLWTLFFLSPIALVSLLQSFAFVALRPCENRYAQRQRSGGRETSDPTHGDLRIPCETDDDDPTDLTITKTNSINRRAWLIRSSLTVVGGSVAVLTTSPVTARADDGSYGNVYVPAVRPTVYQVDSTIPPTLLPVSLKQKQLRILRDLGRGLGTDKKEVFVDRINLNNMLQKAVYGTINTVKGAIQPEQDTLKSPASFVCFGLPMQPSESDVKLNVSLLQTVFENRLSRNPRPPTAIAIATLPCTLQSALDNLIAGRISVADLPNVAGSLEGEALRLLVEELVPLYQPLLEYAVRIKIPLLAIGLSLDDKSAVRSRGIQGVNPTSRARYVVDPEGFIATTNDPYFKLYTDRSLLKDRLFLKTGADQELSEGNYFAERILAHEAAATLVSQYALGQGTECLVAILAPINDLRYMGGINGRIPRIYSFLQSAAISSIVDASSAISSAPVTVNDVTTILLNPTALDTLSRTARLRLEIGTGPDTLAYQTKIADYLWFDSSPPVKLLPRVMDY
jgi:Haem-binding uptake, Tiki superfamily, ChaN